MFKVFVGDDAYTIEKEIKREFQDFKISEAVKVFDLKTLRELLSSKSFFEEKRGFVARDLTKILDKKEEELAAEALIGSSADDLVILVEAAEKKTSPILKAAGKIGALRSFSSKSQNLVDFIKEETKAQGGQIAPLAAERLATMVGADLTQLSEEIKKLVLFKYDEQEEGLIDTSDVDEIVRSNTEMNIFSLIDAYAQRNKKRTAELIRTFIESGENSIYILAMIHRQLRNIAVVLFSERMTEQNLAKALGLHPFVAKKTMEQARRFSKEELVVSYNKLIQADYKLKSGYDPEQTLYLLFA